MAKLLPILPLLFLLISLLITFPATGKSTSFIKSLNPKTLGLKQEKLTHFRVYWHDILSGKNPTAVPITPPVKNSTSAFGLINMIDDPLTEGPELGSKLVGRAQGFYGSAAQDELGLLMAMNFKFDVGKYNGSTITVMGRNKVFSAVREMPVIGGSGLFRFARGYVQAKTHMVDMRSGDATSRKIGLIETDGD
ncbi:hypothetical protein LguiA_013087 [Lonicera macranthoides]